MRKERKDKHFLKKPAYPGGSKAMRTFLSKQKVYPKEALEQKIEGTVHLRYTINHRGSVVRTKVIVGLGHGCDEEAARIVKLLKFEVPPTRKVKVQYHKTIQIHFKLPKEMKRSFVYSTDVKKDSPNHGQPEKVSRKSYQYQIKW